jgi:hypothetical protein
MCNWSTNSKFCNTGHSEISFQFFIQRQNFSCYTEPRVHGQLPDLHRMFAVPMVREKEAADSTELWGL